MNNPFEIIDQRLKMIESSISQLAKLPKPETRLEEKYLTPDQVCDLLSISRVTLWSWDKKGVTNPLRIGNLKRYRLSDIDAMGKKYNLK